MTEFKPEYTLVYFDIRGVAENTRVMFAIAGKSYEDYRYPISFTGGKPQASPEFEAAKANGNFACNMDRLPMLIYRGPSGTINIGQGPAIQRYVAKKLGFNGDSDEEAAMIDMICEHIRDIKQKYNDFKVGKTGDELNAAKTEFVTVEYPKWMAKVEVCLGSSGFAVGTKLSLADIIIHSTTLEFFDDKEAALAAIATCPKLRASVDAVSAAGKDYFAARK
eukprot:CAMPEP_0182417362 /NCGR_PEP_ID=MMETSP1167-20130531/1812_1 /TAXON_ID=2988 /ORGANISM="Mallomonas Sp, Strain CCMP3275" /LENGTH=220 /DNA_ID=CAMNT_0024590857 /DNA_START=90 /DNA_END=752 /DNA_ORIENTATION=+